MEAIALGRIFVACRDLAGVDHHARKIALNFPCDVLTADRTDQRHLKNDHVRQRRHNLVKAVRGALTMDRRENSAPDFDDLVESLAGGKNDNSA